jgi:hypothetical protein
VKDVSAQGLIPFQAGESLTAFDVAVPPLVTVTLHYSTYGFVTSRLE